MNVKGFVRKCGEAVLCAAAVGVSLAADGVLKVGVSDPLAKHCACSCVGDAAKREYEGWKAKVEKDCGVKLELVYFMEDAELADALKKADFDMVVAKATVLDGASRAAGKEFVRLADLQMPAGQAEGLWGEFVVLKDSPVKSVADLKGKRVVFGPLLAVEKDAAPKAALAKAGIAEGDVVPSEQHSCKSAIVELLEGRADAAVISSYAAQYGCMVVVAAPGDVRAVGRTGVFPFITFAASGKLDAPLREKLAKSMLEMKGSQVPADMMSKGVVAPEALPGAAGREPGR